MLLLPLFRQQQSKKRIAMDIDEIITRLGSLKN